MSRTATFDFCRDYCPAIKEDVVIPLKEDVGDVAVYLTTTYDVPCYAREDLFESVRKFVAQETSAYFNNKGDSLLEDFLEESTDESIEKASSFWDSLFVSKRREFAADDKKKTSETELHEKFVDIVKTKPGCLGKMLDREQVFADETQRIVRRREGELSALGVGTIDGVVDYGDMSRFSEDDFRSLQNVLKNYEEKMTDAVQKHKQQYKDFIDELSRTAGLDSTAYRERGLTGSFSCEAQLSANANANAANASSPTATTHAVERPARPSLEESFTVHLGAQLKSMHNIRLTALDPEQLFRHSEDNQLDRSNRLQMALSLYEERLHALVLLVPPAVKHHSVQATSFAKSCGKTSELHFETLSEQLCNVERHLEQAADYRLAKLIASRHLPEELRGGGVTNEAECRPTLCPGDVYVTRHSNLSHVHLAFHLVDNDTLLSEEINSRHPCIGGLRNVVRTSVRYGVIHLSIPLLLAYQMTEKMTTPWCLKRAELVYKCVKGFLIESLPMSRAGSSEARMDRQQFTVQFLLPSAVTPDLFGQLSEMLTQIFQTYGPVKI